MSTAAPPVAHPEPVDALGRRDGLPEPFRYLEGAWPRSAWSAVSLHPMAQHWLEVHGWFRGQLSDLADLGGQWREGRIDAPAYRGAAAPRLRQLLSNLHHHHELETSYAFPRLAAAEPRMSEGFALLDRDHDAIEALLAGMAEAANLLIGAPAAADLAPHADLLAERIDRGGALIRSHLWDEEDIVVPVLNLRGEGVRL